MTETINKIITWIKSNVLLAVLIGAAAGFVLFPKQIKRVLAPARRKRRRRITRNPAQKKSSHRTIPRSVGTKGYAAAGGGYIPFKYNKDGTIKKAWQVAGTLAAKQRMARLRKNR